MRRNSPVVWVNNAPIFFRNKIRSSLTVKIILYLHGILFFLLKRDERVRSGKLSRRGGQDHPLPGHEQHGLHPIHRQDPGDPTSGSASGSVFNLAYVAPDPGSTWLCGSGVRVQLGLCGSRSRFNLAYVAPDPDTTWPMWLRIRVQLGYVALDPGSTWTVWIRIRILE